MKATDRRVLVIVGTRPEAIKIAPIVLAGQHADLGLSLHIVATGQHGNIVSEALQAFGLRADYTLACPRPSGSLPELLSVLIEQLGALFLAVRPEAVVVQGDTSSALAGALAGFYAGLPVVHVEAGLSTGTLAAPFPEEAHRRLISDVTALHLAPTPRAAAYLLVRGVDSTDVVVTGNTVVDAVLHITKGAETRLTPSVQKLVTADKRLVLVTVHRRESWGQPMEQIARALTSLSKRHQDVRIVVVRHPNPHAGQTMADLLPDSADIECIEPLPYAEFMVLLSSASLVLTDSGGLQEELPTLGIRTVVLRAETERPEAMLAGLSVLASTDHDRIVEAATAALASDRLTPSTVNPYGDGHAGHRSAQAIAWILGSATRPSDYRGASEGVDTSTETSFDPVVLTFPRSPS